VRAFEVALLWLDNFKTSGCLVARPTCAPATTRLTPQLVGTSAITNNPSPYRCKGGAIPRATPNHCGAAEWVRGAPKSPNNVTSIFFNTVHVLLKDLSFEHGGAKFASCPGRHLASLRPCPMVLVFITRKICNIK